MAVEILQASVEYQAGTKLLELATDVAESGRTSRPEIAAKINKGYRIAAWLRALNNDQFLTKQEIDKIVLCLAKVAEVNDFPIAPVVTVPSSDVRIGSGNVVNITNNFDTGQPFENLDVDIGTETADEFAVSSATGAVWFYTIQNVSGTIQRSGWITASWLSNGTLVYTPEDSTEDIGGVVDVSLSVDFNSSNVRLRATATTNNWQVFGRRFLINKS